MNNPVMVQPITGSPSRPMRGWGPLFKSRSQHLREHSSTPLKSGRSEFHLVKLCSQLPTRSRPQNGRNVESATRATLTHTDQRTSPHGQESITHSGLRMSCLVILRNGNLLVNGVTSKDCLFRGPVLYKLIV